MNSELIEDLQTLKGRCVDGFRAWQASRRGYPVELYRGMRTRPIRIRDQDLSKHILVAGDSGSGKSTLLRQIMHIARMRGDICIVGDSKREFVREFYDPDRSDMILNPMDVRCPWWRFSGEFIDEPTAIGALTALYPPPLDSNGQFWADMATKVAAHIAARHKPTCAEYARILTDERLIIPLVKGSEHEATFAGDKRMIASILLTLNRVGYAMRMMPPDDPTKPSFCIRDWTEKRDGWIFLTSTDATIDAVRPLQTAWLDMAILGLLSAKKQKRRVWIILDELESYGVIPKLVSAITRLRDTGNVLVIGIQNVNQLHSKYGKDEPTIVSQPFTKVVLRTSHGEPAKEMGALVGDEEVRVIRQSRTTNIFKSHERDSLSGPEEKIQALVLPAQIQGLPDLQGYLLQPPVTKKQGLNVVKVNLARPRQIFKEPGLVERIMPAFVEQPPPPEPAPPKSKPKPPPSPRQWLNNLNIPEVGAD